MVVVLCLLLSSASVLASQIHTYIDERGVKVFTNAPWHGSQSSTRKARVAPASSDPASNFLPLIRGLSTQHGIDENLVRAIIEVESNFDPKAVSPKDCKGLMQLHPDTARRFGVKDIFDPTENIQGGIRYLQFLIDHFDDNLELAVAAYNAGENAVDKYNGVPPYPETRNYVNKVAALYDINSPPSASRNGVPASRIHRILQPGGHIIYTNTPLSLNND